jgi:hypothetical protein
MSAVATRVLREQRFTRAQPCPICGGWQSGPHGQHCHGFYSADYTVAYCSEIAGALPANRAGHFAHHMTNELATRAKVAVAPTSSWRDKRTLHAVISQTLRDGWRAVARFPYHDAGGALLSYVVRYDPPADRPTERKRCYPYQPVGQDWACDELGLTRVLYRLPELRTAPADVPVFIVEGEKCVGALRERSLVATCNPGGAGKWHTVPGARGELQGRTVIVLPDHDEAGRRHASEVAADVAGVAASVRIVELPGLEAGGDVFDWLAAGGDALQLALRALATPSYVVPTDASKPNAHDDETTAREQQEQEALRAANIELNRRLNWTQRVVAVPKDRLSPGAAQTAIFMQRELPKHQRQLDAQGFWMPYMPAVAMARGVSATTLGQHLIELADVGAMRRRELYQIERPRSIVSPWPSWGRPRGAAPPFKRKCRYARRSSTRAPAHLRSRSSRCRGRVLRWMTPGA